MIIALLLNKKDLERIHPDSKEAIDLGFSKDYGAYIGDLNKSYNYNKEGFKTSLYCLKKDTTIKDLEREKKRIKELWPNLRFKIKFVD